VDPRLAHNNAPKTRKLCIILIYVKRYGISQSADSQRRSSPLVVFRHT
jgi:hypothetical protein